MLCIIKCLTLTDISKLDLEFHGHSLLTLASLEVKNYNIYE